MKHYQDKETGEIYGFDDHIDPMSLGLHTIPKTLSQDILPKPSETSVWFQGGWIEACDAPAGYQAPASSVPIYDPSWVGIIQPYTFVTTSSLEFSTVTLEQINQNSYASERFGEIVGALPIEGSNLDALVSHDGTLLIPDTEACFSKETAVNNINRVFCAILIGGIFIEALSAPEIHSGSLADDGRSQLYTLSLNNNIRYKFASPTERIQLISPRVLTFEQLRSAYDFGKLTLSSIPTLSPFFIIHGHTSLIRGNLIEALSSLWIACEQITSHIWDNIFIKKPEFNPPIPMPSRRDSLRSDNRTWSIAVRHELLWQRSIITDICYSRLSASRGARNKLAHAGISPNFVTVQELLIGITELIEAATNTPQDMMRKIIPQQPPPHSKSRILKFDGWRNVQSHLKF